LLTELTFYETTLSHRLLIPFSEMKQVGDIPAANIESQSGGMRMVPLRSRRDFILTAGRCSAGLAFCGLAGQLATTSTLAEPRSTLDQLDAANVQRFVGTIKGRAIRPTDADYDSVRQIWNAAFDKHPGLIVACSGPTDVARTLEFARKHDLLLAIRSGGHSLAGKSSCDGGVVIDLSGLKEIKIDSVKRTARVEPGLTLAEFDRATQAQGLATTSGTEPTTGMAGLTLGGGLGWLMGKYGLACDNLRSVDIVLADGRTLTASRTINEELFWAVRGAGANFGVVTALEYDLHPIATILAGVIKYPPESLGDVLKHYREFTNTIPDEVGISVGIIPSRSGKPIVSMAVSYCGDLDQGEKVLQALRDFRPVLSDEVKPMPYLAFQKLGALPPGLRLHSVIRSGFLKEFSDSTINVIAANAAAAPPFSGSFVIECVHGKASRTSPTATAFPHRFTGHNFSLHADWVAPSGEASAKEWGTSFWSAMQPFVRSAVYSNYLGDEGPARARASYGDNYERLAVLKRKYDPTNIFCLNQNIAPSA
jgi:FAD/FMN-containing dehydrogenase